jgi:hypothetical protein
MAPSKKPTESPSRLPLLVGLAVVMAGVLLWDRRDDRRAETAPPHGGATAPGTAAPEKAGAEPQDAGAEAPADKAQDAHPLASLALDELHDTVRRPLFEKARRPVEPQPVRQAAVPVPQVALPRRMADPNALTLLGVLMNEGGSSIALLRRNQTGQNVRLQEGDTVDGWTIERIEAEGVTLRQGDTKIALQLFRKR